MVIDIVLDKDMKDNIINFFEKDMMFDKTIVDYEDEYVKATLKITPTLHSTKDNNKEVEISFNIQEEKDTKVLSGVREINDLYDFVEGIYEEGTTKRFEVSRGSMNMRTVFRIRFKPEINKDNIIKKRNYFYSKISHDKNYINNAIYSKSLSDDLERIDLLYLLLLNFYIHFDLVQYRIDLNYLEELFSYYGYDYISDKPKDELSLEEIYNEFLYYVTGILYEDDNSGFDISSINKLYEKYNELYIKEKGIA